MIDIFISWSGERSKLMAEFLSRWLKKVFQLSNPWISKDIPKGKRWHIEIGEKLNNCNIGLICVTPENYNSPWLNFEAGALSKYLDESKVCPILLGMLPQDLDGPLSQFQATIITKEDVWKLLKTLNCELKSPERLEENILKDIFEKYWPEFKQKMKDLLEIKIQHFDLSSIINIFAKLGLPQPLIDYQIYFSCGFETHSLYTAITRIASKRLLIFGRKNRKLFDKNYYSFFKNLKSHIQEGFDFRVLFLDPDAPASVLKCAHKDEDFHDQLISCIKHAYKILIKIGLEPENHIRFYKIHRNVMLHIVDNALLFTPICLDQNGCAEPVTDSPFTILKVNSKFGNKLLTYFESVWNSSRTIDRSLFI